MALLVKNLPAVQETWVQSLVWEDPLEKGFSLYYISLVIVYVYEVYWFLSINFLSLCFTISILYSIFILSYTIISSALRPLISLL